MTLTERHELSTLALDVYWASGCPTNTTIEQHLRGCARCHAYLARLDASLPEPRRSTEGPVSAQALVRVRRGWMAPTAAALALAAVVALVVHTRPSNPAGYVGTKGTPAVQLLLHRGNDTHVWDRAEHVRQGDALAIRVACEGLGQVAVATLDRDGWHRLADTTCPRGDEPLPFTLVVDAEPRSERVVVVLSRDALDDDRLREAIGTRERTGDVWAVDFVLDKDTETDR